MEENLHDGHRNRLRELAFKNNFKNMEQHQLLELLLSYVIPRKDTNPIAHRLIKKFGSFTGVLDASKEDLVQVDGVGNTTASFIASLKHFFYAYNAGKINSSSKITNVKEAVEYTEKLFKGKNIEEPGVPEAFKVLVKEFQSIGLDVKILTEELINNSLSKFLIVISSLFIFLLKATDTVIVLNRLVLIICKLYAFML